MSMQAMASFLEKTQSDGALTENLVQILANNEGDEITSKVIDLAKANGFDITASDVEETRKQFAQHAEAGDGELSDDDLENVSGGIGALTMPSYFDLVKAGETVLKSGVNSAAKVTTNDVRNAVDQVGDFLKRW